MSEHTPEVQEVIDALAAAAKELESIHEWHKVETIRLRFRELASISNTAHRARAALSSIRKQEVGK